MIERGDGRALEHDRERVRKALRDSLAATTVALRRHVPGPRARPVGRITSVGRGVASVTDLREVCSVELLKLGTHGTGIAWNVDRDSIGVVLLAGCEQLRAGDEAQRTGRVVEVPVGEELLGRVLGPLGQPLDGGAPPHVDERRPAEREVPPILHRASVSVPLQTGLKVVDALFPIGRGQRELILGDRQTGKTSIAIDTILAQRGKEVVCVYCAIGQRTSAVAKRVEELRKRGALEFTIVVVAEEEEAPGMRFLAPYAATSMAEWFMERGRDVLIVYDDLTRHAWAYRELSLLLRRPPGREAFPGDVFYLHARLLERATHLRPHFGGGSLTALPIAETQAQNLSAYIPTNLISITDGQLYLSPTLFNKGVLPAVEIGRSVSRVGGKAQLAAYRGLTGRLRLAHAQFEELEAFARFGTQLDAETVRRLERGRRVREVLQQPDYEPLPVAEQVLAFLALDRGAFDEVPLAHVKTVERALRARARDELPHECERIEAGEPVSDEDAAAVERVARDAAAERQEPAR